MKEFTNYFNIVMTSQNSGYISMTRNFSDLTGAATVCTTLSVPASHVVIISYKEAVERVPDVRLYQSTCQTSQSDDGPKYVVWKRKTDPESDFAHLCHTTHFSLVVDNQNCKHTGCFKLFFSFFSENKQPVKLANGLWNCSVEHYTSFHHHLACNLKTECEDGRDETGDCPYSSPQCPGMIDLCDHCYTIVDSLRGFASYNTDIIERAKEYCHSIGGQLSLPICVYDLFTTIRNKTKIHPKRLKGLLGGLYAVDSLLPTMYERSLIQKARTVIHHSFFYITWLKNRKKVCFKLKPLPHSLTLHSCTSFKDIEAGAFCEFQKNNTGQSSRRSLVVSVNSTGFPLSKERQSMTQCPGGHVTHTFLLCGSDQYQICGQQPMSPCVFSDQLSGSHESDLSDHHSSVVPTFTCNDGVTKLSFTLVCNFVTDCLDESDESFCQHPPCVREFRCANGQCLPFGKVCDELSHCSNKEDENCTLNFELFFRPYPSPVLVQFDGFKYFVPFPMDSSESCPDTHYRCPGEFNDCLPIYTRCNSMYDCIGHQDEEGCEEIACSGFFRCRNSKICVHYEHICDGWSHCPMNDDELVCNVTCPTNCLCQGHTFLCPQPFSAAHFPQLRYLDATGSGMTLSDVSKNALLIGVVFAHCSIKLILKTHLLNLKILDLGGNMLQYINMTSFLGLQSLQTVSLSHNPLISLNTGPSSVHQHSSLTALDLSHTTLTVFDSTVLSLFPNVQKLNLTSTSIHTISPAGFKSIPLLTELHLDNSPVKTFPPDIFTSLSSLRYISTQNYKLCCTDVLPHNFDIFECIAPRDELSSCKDLLQSWTYNVFLWLVTCLSLTGNVFCCCARLFTKRLASSSGFSVFVTNLSIADFLMGVYITVIGVADEWFRGQYLYNDDIWKNSITCKGAGFLSLLSSEVSALIIWFITLDRFIVLHFPFSSMRFGRRSASVACLLTWLTGFFLAMLPLLPATSHWEFYGQTGICVPLPVTRQDFKGWVYSFSVLIVFNFILFLFVSAGQALIYWTIQQNAMKGDSTKVSRDMTIARRLITIAVTDFMCWFPIGLCGLLALAGIRIPGEISVILAIFVLPLNSAINPFMYTFNTLAEEKRRRNEAKLLEWLETQPQLDLD